MPKKVMRKAHSRTAKNRVNREYETDDGFDEVEHASELEKALVRNLVQLQKVHASLAEKFDKLAKEISQILALFEITAKNFAKNAPLGEYEKDKDFLEKIDRLLEQNKTLARGLMLMEERLRERMYGGMPQSTAAQQRRREPPTPEEAFQPSIASGGKRPLPRF